MTLAAAALLALWLLPGAVMCLRAHTRPLGIAWWLWPPSLLLPPVLVPVALWWTTQTQAHPDELTPAWGWLQTPDCPLPGNTTIPAVADVLARRGWFMASWYWLGVRNPAQGLAWAFGRDIAAPWWSLEPGYYSDPASGLWWERRSIMGGRFQLKRGWRPYPNPAGGFRLVPCLTITRP